MSTIVFLTPPTMGDALGGIGRSYRTLFNRLGFGFEEIDFGKPDPTVALGRTLQQGPVEFVFSFLGMGADIMSNTSDGGKRSAWEAMGIPYLSIYGDTPGYFFDRHVLPAGPVGAIYAFPEHLEVRKRLPGATGLMGLLPPSPLDVMERSDLDFARKEKGKLYFLKNGNDPAALYGSWRRYVPEHAFLLLSSLADELGSHIDDDVGNDIDAFVVRRLRDRGIDIERHQNLRLFFLAQLDDYLRRLKSTLMAEALLDFPVEIHGYNWEHVDFAGRRARLVPGGDYGKSRDLIRDGLGILDMSPNTGLAAHERPLRAFGMHTLCLTNEQPFFREHFAQHESFTFRFRKEDLQRKVDEVLSHPRRHVELGVEVAAEFRRRHTPEAFGQYLLDMASCLRLSANGRSPEMQPYFAWPPNVRP
jgi:hypothetical protein